MKQKFYTQSYVDRSYNHYDLYGCRGNYAIETEYDKYDDAVEAAKKTASKTKEDVVIYKIASVVKFPTDNLKVVELD